jgi:hypothetical protein
MIVPAVPKYLEASNFARGTIKEGTIFFTDSGLGGSFQLRFKGWEAAGGDEGGDVLVFENLSHEYRPLYPEFRYKVGHVHKHVYLLQPENPAFRS